MRALGHCFLGPIVVAIHAVPAILASAYGFALMRQVILDSVKLATDSAVPSKRVLLDSPTNANGRGTSLEGDAPNVNSLLAHIWSQYGVSGRDLARHLVARQSWEREYASGGWKAVVVPESVLRRTARTVLGDPRKLPFVKDLLDFGVRWARHENALLIFSNFDVLFAPGLTETLRHVTTCAYASRHEFVRLKSEPTCLEIVCARKHPGCDLFAMTPAWWQEHRRDYPDMLLGAPAWDMVMRRLMQLTGGVELHAALAHEEHASHWLTHRGDPSATYNERLAAAWLAERHLAWV